MKPTCREQPQCRICSTPSKDFGVAEVLCKYQVQYYRCPSCGFIQTESPYWLQEAYASTITAGDVGYVQRNVSMAKLTKAVIHFFLKPDRRFIDFGGGYGLFVRMMRDAGFDFYRFDPLCQNLFALGFDIAATPPASGQKQPFELLTAFEVAEHLEQPAREFRTMLEFADTVFFSTTLVPNPPPQLGSWWYYGAEHGQHLAFYTQDALSHLAADLDMNLTSDGRALHILSRQKLSSRWFKFLIEHGKFAATLNTLKKRRSLLENDVARLTETKVPAPLVTDR